MSAHLEPVGRHSVPTRWALSAYWQAPDLHGHGGPLDSFSPISPMNRNLHMEPDLLTDLLAWWPVRLPQANGSAS